MQQISISRITAIRGQSPVSLRGHGVTVPPEQPKTPQVAVPEAQQ